MPIRRALVSVSDKTGLIEFSRFLIEQGVEILSTGGTAKELRKANIPVTDVSDYTQFPEIMGGRVKTINPLIEGGILGLRDQHSADADANLPIKPKALPLHHPTSRTSSSSTSTLNAGAPH